MKKNYTKPQIIFENFSMSTNIAGDCEVKANTNNNYDSCGHLYGDVILFGTDLTGCTKYGSFGRPIAPNTGLTDDGICYHVPSESSNIFNS